MSSNHSFTDEQLLNLINNTILTKTEYEIKDFTGGSVQITSTNNHQLIKYKLSLFFGYKGKNSICRTIDINEELLFIWQKSLLLKIKSLQTSNNGMAYSELNSLMNSSSNTVVSNIVVSKGINTPLKDTLKQVKKFSFSLDKQRLLSSTSKEHQTKLKEYIDNSSNPMSYEDFYNQCEMKPYKYKNFKIAYEVWYKKNETKPNVKLTGYRPPELGGWN